MRDSQRVELPRREAAILRALTMRRGRPVSREQLAQEAWGEAHFPNTRTIDNLVMQLRHRIEPPTRSARAGS